MISERRGDGDSGGGIRAQVIVGQLQHEGGVDASGVSDDDAVETGDEGLELGFLFESDHGPILAGLIGQVQLGTLKVCFPQEIDFLGRAENLDLTRNDAINNEVQFPGSRRPDRDIDDAALDERASVGDAKDLRFAVLEVSHPHASAELQGFVRCGGSRVGELFP